jgi:NRE family putative nickel resistance protein-like MFS transporter
MINLIGDALTWLGLALLAFELAGEQAGLILSRALTLRVMAFVVLSPIAGVIADRVDRQQMMVITHLARMGIVCLFPFVTQPWQIYVIVLLLNAFSAFFTPTYTATIPLVTGKADVAQAIALSSATYQLLGVFGPAFAGSLAAFIGTRSVFWFDGLTFGIAAILISTLPGRLSVAPRGNTAKTFSQTLRDLRTGTTCLLADLPIRSALMMQLVAAIAGAQILVNTVGYVQGMLALGKVEYGWVMAAFGIGAALASIGWGNAGKLIQPTMLVGIGAGVITLAILPANIAGFPLLLCLWLLAGMGQTLVNLPTQTLIADRVATDIQGRVYGAHFAWSHLWWAFAYPLAGWTGSHLPTLNFFYGGLIGAALLIIFYLGSQNTPARAWDDGLWHEHEHIHDLQHTHPHISNHRWRSHSHLHFHPGMRQ